ncbi:MAG: hypothetical protein ACOC4M_11090 [Promethearchaeia archaeon]
MQIFTLILIIIGTIIGLLLLLLLLIYLFLPYYFLIYAKRYDGSYDPKEDPIKKHEWNVQHTENFGTLREISIEFKKKRGAWKILHKKDTIIDDIHLWFYFKRQKYSSHSNELDTISLTLTNYSEEVISHKTLGKCKKSLASWQIKNTNIIVTARISVCQDKSCILFQISTNHELEVNEGETNHPVNLVFPAFENRTSLKRTLSYDDNIFCPTQRDFDLTHGPVCLFNDNKENVILSALNRFLISPWVKTESNRSQYFQFGIHSSINIIPKGFQHESIMVFGEKIRKNFVHWANILREYNELPKKPLNPDLPTTYLGYYTDNGSYYYYNTEKGMKAGESLIKVKEYAEENGIPYNHYQIDSWWYQKTTSEAKQKWLGWLSSIFGTSLYGGALLWEPDPDYLEMSPKELSSKLDAPLTAHNRWFNSHTPYKEQYDFIEEDGWAMPHDDAFWDHIMRYCKENNIIVHEQDWMVNQIKHFSHLRNTIDGAENWLGQMATNAEKYGITIQYCMETPAMVMQSIFYPAVTHCRTSDDYHGYTFKTYDVPGFTQASLLAHVLGLRPFKDVFKTKKYPLLKYRGERIAELECLIASLSTGPVAPGDKYKDMSRELIMRSCRKDGKLLQPTFPLTAIDLMYVENHTYYVASAELQTRIDQKDFTWFYVLTINLFPKRVKKNEYAAEEFYLPNIRYIEFDWHSHKMREVSSSALISQKLEFEEYKYRVYAPILLNSVALIGNIDKFTTFNSVQFHIQEITGNSITVTISGLEQEKVSFIVVILDQTEPKFELMGKLVKRGEFAQFKGFNTKLTKKIKPNSENLALIQFDFEFSQKNTVDLQITV